MLSSPTQFGLALTTLVVWPLLGAGNQVRAGFMLNPPAEHSPLSFTVHDALLIVDGGMDSSDEVQDSTLLRQPREERIPESRAPGPPCLVFFSLWTLGLGQSPGGCTSTSGVSSVGVPGLHATLSAPVVLPPRAQVCRLTISDIPFQPPPFPSRLFRPPRLA